MKVLVQIPSAIYDLLMSRHDRHSPAFPLLINGCVEVLPGKRREEQRVLQILCQDQQAAQIIELANAMSSETAAKIEVRPFPTGEAR